MYAIIADGGRQYRVEEGQELDIDYREAATRGDELAFERVLAVAGDEGIQFGQPTLGDVSVTAEVLGVQQGPKIYVQKLRRRKNYRRRTGHRQLYTRVRINRIDASSGSTPAATETTPVESSAPEGAPEAGAPEAGAPEAGEQ